MKLAKLLSQKSPGKWLGGTLDVWLRTTVVINIANTVMIAGTFYEVTGAGVIHRIFPAFNIWHFYAVGVSLALTGMILVYKYLLPSTFEYQNLQQYKHQNLIRRDIAELSEQIADIQTRLNGNNENLRKLAVERTKRILELSRNDRD